MYKYDPTPIFNLILEQLNLAIKNKDWKKVKEISESLKLIIE